MCAALLGATWPLIGALPSAPSTILGGEAYVITQGSGAPSINDSLVQNLTTQPWAQAVSGEILSLGTIDGSAVLLRGADFSRFLALEGAVLVEQSGNVSFGVLVGQALEVRLGLDLGEGLTLQGSSVPRIAVAEVVGVFRASGAANDELLAPLGIARFLTGVPAHWYHEIRLKTSDPASLVSFLRSFRASVHVTGPSGSIGESNTAPATDPRLVNLFLRGATGALPPAYLAEALTEATNSVQVVALGLGILVAAMIASALCAILARGFAARREAIGVLRSMGAGRRWIGARLLRESLPYMAVAVVSGIVGGAAFVSTLGPFLGLRLFGHEFPVAIDGLVLASFALILVAFAAASLLWLVRQAFLDRPIEAIRDTSESDPPRSLEVVLRD